MADVSLIFLIGMPAAGKTYWGNQLATVYNWTFIDLDAYIAEREGSNIPNIFAHKGEQAFREAERKYLIEVIEKATTNTVIACGGGTPCFYDNMQLMKSAGKVIYLDADIATLQHNIQMSEEIRPMLEGQENITAFLENLLKQRQMFYRQANYILPTKDISLTTFAEIITHV